MSATRPATEFSIGIMPRSTSPAIERRKAVLEGRAGHRFVVRIGLTAGQMRICPRLALKNDLLLGHVSPCRAFRPQTWQSSQPASSSRALSKSSGVSTPSGTLFRPSRRCACRYRARVVAPASRAALPRRRHALQNAPGPRGDKHKARYGECGPVRCAPRVKAPACSRPGAIFDGPCLDDVGICRAAGSDDGGQRRDVDFLIGQRLSAAPMSPATTVGGSFPER